MTAWLVVRAAGILAALAALLVLLVILLSQAARPASLTAAGAVSRAAEAVRSERYDVAGSYLLFATQEDPNNGDANYMLAQSYERAGRFEEALGAYRSAARLMPADPAPRYNMALVLIALGRSEEGLVEAEAAVAAGMPAARFALAAAYRALKRWEEAAATYARLLADEGQFPLDWVQAYLQYGDLEWERGQAGVAAKHWLRALGLAPKNSEVQERLRRVQ